MFDAFLQERFIYFDVGHLSLSKIFPSSIKIWLVIIPFYFLDPAANNIFGEILKAVYVAALKICLNILIRDKKVTDFRIYSWVAPPVYAHEK